MISSSDLLFWENSVISQSLNTFQSTSAMWQIVIQTCHQGKPVYGGADKSLVQPTSQCRSVVGKRGLFTCWIASLFLLCPVQRLKGSFPGDARNFNNIETWVIKFFFPLQSKAPKEIQAILTETLGQHAPLYATVRNLVAQFKHHLWCTLSWTTQNSDHPGGYWSNSLANLGRLPDLG